MIDNTALYVVEVMFVATVILVALLAALITVGLERQRKELAEIRKQIENWAGEDLEVKRVKLAPQINVPDPAAWLNTCAARAMGGEPGIARFPVETSYGEPKVLAAEDAGGRRYLLSAHTPEAIRRIPVPGRWPWSRSRLSRFGSNLHPLVPLNGKIETYQLSTLNCGIAFDLEAAQVWKKLTGEDLKMKELWLYVMP
ncbi:MAG: hypothetical protein JW929_03515 [Anaerolineales bacterium]|nr:hypothetical protein [Anaerolineales bacterium]